MKKNKIAMNRAEWTCALHALNDLRNRMIAEGRYTDVLDELILKIDKAPIRKEKVKAAHAQ
jgi:hypothetical protein